MSLTAILDDSKLSPVQWVAIIICISLNALDGFDVLAISFASPGIAAEWGINRAELGVVLAMVAIALAVGVPIPYRGYSLQGVEVRGWVL